MILRYVFWGMRSLGNFLHRLPVYNSNLRKAKDVLESKHPEVDINIFIANFDKINEVS